jgi:protein-L-isoaspartate(D-aspartate) O-methyltransferase
MGEVKRELFVPEGRLALAYADAPVPLGPGRGLNSPMALGRLLTEAAPQPGDKALVVGAATGYSAALLARLVGSVVALEEDEKLAALAGDLLAGSGVAVVEGPLARGHPGGAPYDLILIDGAVGSVPDSLIAQLRDGGRLAAAILDEGVTRIAIGRKAGEGFAMVSVADVAAVLLPGFARPRAFMF